MEERQEIAATHIAASAGKISEATK